jgi:hypothetical protein
MAKHKKKEKRGNDNGLVEIRIIGVPKSVHDQLMNISIHENGHNKLSSLLRPHLRKIVESYPEEKRLPPRDY